MFKGMTENASQKMLDQDETWKTLGSQQVTMDRGIKS